MSGAHSATAGAAGVPLRWHSGECVLPRLALLAVGQLLLHGLMLAAECAGVMISDAGAPLEVRCQPSIEKVQSGCCEASPCGQVQRRKHLQPLSVIYCTLTTLDVAFMVALVVTVFDSKADDVALAAVCGSFSLIGAPHAVWLL